MMVRRQIANSLSSRQPPEVMAALRYLLRKTGADDGLRYEMARKLIECQEEHLVNDLLAMVRDVRDTPRWRGYCLQHLSTCYELNPDSAILDTFHKAAESREETVRAAALCCLARIAASLEKSETPDEAALARIRAAALSALRERDEHIRVHIAAVQSCARLGLTEVLTRVREIARDDSAEKSDLRKWALSALGDLGNSEDIPFLEQLAESSPPGAASKNALVKLRERLSEP